MGLDKGMGTGMANLLRVHLELADDLDGDLTPLAGGISCAVDIAEGAIAHLLDQGPALQAWIPGELALGLTLLGYDTLEHLGVDLGLLGVTLLPVAHGVGGSIASLGGDVAVVASAGADGIVAVGSGSMLQGLVAHGRFGDAMMDGVGGVVALLLRLGVDVGDVGSGLCVLAGLLAVAQEVLKILYRSHV